MAELFAFDKIEPIFKWIHIFMGIMWIGLLYFFNFVNTAFAPTMSGDTKKAVVPELMPRALYWFRWGAAWTWFSGVVLLIAVFWFAGGESNLGFGSTATGDPLSDDGGISMMMDGSDIVPAEEFTDANQNETYDDGEEFIDANNNGKWDGKTYTPEPELNQYTHIMLAVTFLAVFIYDFLYKKVKFGITCPIAKNTRLITIVSFLLIAVILYCMTHCAGWGYRASNIHIGAMFGSIMAFNVWFRIWPAQQKIITAIKNGEAPDGDLVALAGLRSKHNTYLSLPLIWTMINAHTVVYDGKAFNYEGGVLLIVIALGWHIIFQCYKKSAKVQGF